MRSKLALDSVTRGQHLSIGLAVRISFTVMSLSILHYQKKHLKLRLVGRPMVHLVLKFQFDFSKSILAATVLLSSSSNTPGDSSF